MVDGVHGDVRSARAGHEIAHPGIVALRVDIKRVHGFRSLPQQRGHRVEAEEDAGVGHGLAIAAVAGAC